MLTEGILLYQIPFEEVFEHELSFLKHESVFSRCPSVCLSVDTVRPK